MLNLSRKVLLIAKREYLEKVRGRAFRFSTVLVPGLMILLMAGSYFATRGISGTRHIVIAGDNAALANAMRTELAKQKNARLAVDVMAPATENEHAALTQQVRQKAIDGYLLLQTQRNGSLSATYISSSTGEPATAQRLQAALDQALLQQRLSATGMPRANVDALLSSVQIDALQLNSSGRVSRGSTMVVLGKIIFEIFLLTMPILLYGMDMARSIIEEKSSRIFEVMLSIVRPSDLLMGKLIGIGAVGLTQIAIWAVAAGLLSGSALAAVILRGNYQIQFSWTEGFLFPVYFVLGFLLYSALFSGLAATCETVQEFQMYAPLAVLPTWFSFGIIPLVMNNPNSLWAVGASLFPFTAPFTMVPRVGLQTPPLWQIGVSIALLILSIWVVLWFSSRLYRIGILMYGKRATIPEIMRWLRYS